jgi:multidrug efflux pump subunit AcrB
MALLIMIFGVGSALRTPIDIFPSINIPVVSVVFSYTGCRLTTWPVASSRFTSAR